MTSGRRYNLFSYGIAIPFAIVLAFPFLWMAVTSFKPEAQVYDPTKVWSFHPTLANYGFLFHHTEYVRWLRGPLPEASLLVAGGVEIDQVEEYLQLGVAAVGLTEALFPPEALSRGDTALVTALARRAAAASRASWA